MTESEDAFVISDQAVTVYTWLVFGVISQMINFFGIVTNIINIICFAKQGFQDSVNISLLGLAVSDLGSLTTMIGTCICLTPAVVAAELPFDTREVTYLTTVMAHLSFTRVSGCITAMITLERCLCITYPLKIKSIITPRRTTVVTVCVFIIFFSSSAPVWAVNRLDVKFSPSRNRTIIGLVSTEDRETVELISFAINNFAIPFGAFVIILVCTTILAFQLRSQSKWRQKTSNSTQGDRISSRSQKTSQMVVMISTLFIVCFIPITIVMLATGFLPELSVNGKYMNLTIVVCGLCYIMESINSSMNIFIYYRMSSKFRDFFIKYVCKEISSKDL